MEFEDSRNALFCEPNAYPQKHIEKKESKKVIFQQPYETLPNFYVNNNFSKDNCDCVNNKHMQNFDSDHCGANCNEFKHNCNRVCSNQNNFNFKNLLPILTAFNGGKGLDISNIMGFFNNQNVGDKSMPNMNLISSLLSNKDFMSIISNLLSGGALNIFSRKQTNIKKIKTTDFEIKNYTRVE